MKPKRIAVRKVSLTKLAAVLLEIARMDALPRVRSLRRPRTMSTLGRKR